MERDKEKVSEWGQPRRAEGWSEHSVTVGSNSLRLSQLFTSSPSVLGGCSLGIRVLRGLAPRTERPEAAAHLVS